MEIIFVRHGESQANIEKVFSNTGFKHGLTDRGRRQVHSLAKRLKNLYLEFDKIYASPLKRAVQSAEILSTYFGIIPEIDSRLIEFSVGELEDKTDSTSWSQFMDLWVEWFDHNNMDASLPQGESLSQIITRIEDFLKNLRMSYEDFPKGRNIVVTHGGVIMSSFPHLLSNLSFRFRKNFYLDTTDFINVEMRGSNIYVKTIYCTLRK